MGKQAVLITVSGPDRPGITAKLMTVIVRNGHRVLDMGQAVTHGLLSLSFLLDLEEGRSHHDSAVLKDLLFEAKKMGLGLDFEVVEDASERRLTGEEFVLSCVAPQDIGPGFIAATATLLADYRINILRIDNVSRDSFRALEVKTLAPADTPWSELKKKLVLVSQEHQVDVAFQQAHLFRTNKRLIVFDMDSTLIQAEVIDEMAKAHGVEKEISAITQRAMEGEIDFRKSLLERVQMLKGMPVEKMEKICQELPITPGAREFVQKVRSMGYKVAVITGGFSYFATHIKKVLGLDYSFANELEVSQGLLTGKVKGNIIDADQKAFLMDLLAQQEHISLEQVVAVGDGANDLPMLTRAGLGIAFHAKPIVKEKAQHHMSYGPMTSILPFLGIPGA